MIFDEKAAAEDWAQYLEEQWKNRHPDFMRAAQLVREGATGPERIMAYMAACDAELAEARRMAAAQGIEL